MRYSSASTFKNMPFEYDIEDEIKNENNTEKKDTCIYK